MEKEFIPYTLALELKSLGFDEPCFGRYYYKESYPMLNPRSKETELVFELGQYLEQTEVTILAPTFSQTFRFFREKYGLHSYIEPVLVEKANSPIKYDYVILEVSHQDDLEYNNLPYHTFEEAELACLEKLIQIVKDGK